MTGIGTYKYTSHAVFLLSVLVVQQEDVATEVEARAGNDVLVFTRYYKHD